jgi:hypothetical protein
MFVNSLQAQMPPTISDNWRGSGIGYSDARDRGLTIRSLRPYSQNEDPVSVVDTPLAPATLLLLGLGSVAVGGTVYRNTKKRQ